MEFNDVVKNRSSVRNFSDKPVEQEKIRYVLECARQAPSWRNKQCWRFIVITNKETIHAVAKTTIINRWLKSAPVLIIACADPLESGTHNQMEYFLVDVSIAMEHIVLAATDVGLGTCWIGDFNEQKIKNLLQIPKRIRVVTLTPLGYSAGTRGIVQRIIQIFTKGSKRKSLEEIIHYEKW